MHVRIRNAGQEREEEPVIMKKTFDRVVSNMKHNTEEMRLQYIHKLNEKNFLIDGHKHNESLLRKEVDRQVQMTWILSACSFVAGVGAGCLIL